jgi:hypothetical protein
VKTLITVTLVCCFTCTVGWAQSTAEISGTVRDASGLAVPGVLGRFLIFPIIPFVKPLPITVAAE